MDGLTVVNTFPQSMSARQTLVLNGEGCRRWHACFSKIKSQFMCVKITRSGGFFSTIMISDTVAVQNIFILVDRCG